MQIFVRTPIGKTIHLEVERFDTIGKLKATIQKIEGIPPHQQHLIVDAKELQGSGTMYDYNMPHDFVMYMNLKFEVDMRIFVKTSTGKIITLVVESSDTIANVKKQIQKIEGIPCLQQLLFIAGNKLQNCKTLCEHKIRSDSTLDLFNVLRWGGDDMHINLVTTLPGKTTRLLVKSLETISYVKAKLWVIEGIRVSEPCFVFDGQWLNNGKTLRDYDIQNEETVYVHVHECPGWYNIFVKTLTGKTITTGLVNDRQGTVVSLKAKIHEIEGIPPLHQRLVTNAQNLDDVRTLADYNIHQGSTLDLVLTFGGGNMWIFVKFLRWTLDTIMLEVESSDTVRDVKAKIEEIASIPINQQILHFDNKTLINNSRTLVLV